MVKLNYCFNCGIKLEIDNINFCYNCGQDFNVFNQENSNELSFDDYFNSKYELISSFEKAKKFKTKTKINIKKRYNYWKHIKENIDEIGLFEETWINYYCPGFLIPIKGVCPDLARFELLIWNGFIECDLFISKDRYSDDGLYKYIKANKKYFEEKLGFKLSWTEHAGVVFISIYSPINLNDMDLWEDAEEWHMYMIEKFNNVFADEIKKYVEENTFKLDSEPRSEYWAELDKYIDFDTIRKFNPPNKGACSMFTFEGIGFNVARLDLHAYHNKHQIQIAIRIPDDSDIKLFNYLKKNRKDIEDELGFKLDWISKNNQDIKVTYKLNIKDKSNWDEAIKWHSEMVNKFKKVFYPRITEYYKVLDAEKIPNNLNNVKNYNIKKMEKPKNAKDLYKVANLCDHFKDIMENYQEESKKPYGDNPYGNKLRRDYKNDFEFFLKNIVGVKEDITPKIATGQGKWSRYPDIKFSYNKVCTKFTVGFYPLCLPDFNTQSWRFGLVFGAAHVGEYYRKRCSDYLFNLGSKEFPEIFERKSHDSFGFLLFNINNEDLTDEVLHEVFTSLVEVYEFLIPYYFDYTTVNDINVK